MDNPLIGGRWSQSLSTPLQRHSFTSPISAHATAEEVEDFVILWLTEGTAHCFADTPAAMQRVRRFVGERLHIHPKNVGLCGSSKLGFSLSPRKALRSFDKGQSDLDLFIVDASIFSKLDKAFQKGLIITQDNMHRLTRREREAFDSNVPHVLSTLRRGFIDTHKMPYVRGIWSSGVASRCENCLADLRSYLAEAPFSWSMKKSAGLRVYRDWPAAIKQNAISVSSALEKLSNASA